MQIHTKVVYLSCQDYNQGISTANVLGLPRQELAACQCLNEEVAPGRTPGAAGDTQVRAAEAEGCGVQQEENGCVATILGWGCSHV